jgi:peroxidase
MQTLFNREHNRISTALAKINPSWDDETLYQESRRIVIAELQHIAYNEFLPQISGNTSLSPLTTNTYFTGYDSTVNKMKHKLKISIIYILHILFNFKVDPQLTGEFSTAAFRYGHTLIKTVMSRSNINQDFNLLKNKYFPSYLFHNSLFHSDMAYK